MRRSKFLLSVDDFLHILILKSPKLKISFFFILSKSSRHDLIYLQQFFTFPCGGLYRLAIIKSRIYENLKVIH